MAVGLAELIVNVADYPKPGVGFKDITPLIADPEGLAAAIEQLVEAAPDEVDVVLGIEARGFLFAAPVAYALGAGLVPVRKPGKLPRAVESVTYDLEYGTDTVAVHADALWPGARVLVIDDILATGGTMAASVELVQRLGAHVVGVLVVAELSFLGGREHLAAAGVSDVQSLIDFADG